MKKSVLTLVAIALLTLSSFAQVAINTTGAPANASAILDVSSTDKGMLIPRMTTNNRTNDVTPVAGLLVYDTDTESFWYYDGTQSSWVEIKAGSALDINSLADGISDSTSVFLGSNAGSADDGTNYNTALGINTLTENTSGKHNVAIGNAALANNKWRSGLVAIGDSALYTSPGTSVYFYGTENTAIGASALLSNTIGSTNTAIGYNTMYSNTSGNNNTAVGKAALYSNTEGYYNTSIGYKSMYNNTDGGSNTAVGNSTLRDNTTGDYNTAIGRSALISSTTASRNTAAGYRALYYDTTGSYNTATGFYSLYKNRNGDYNNASGYQSMYCNTTGSSNVAMGVNSLYYNTTRSNLVAIGDSALYNNGLGATGDTEATANTAVGSKALYSNTTGHNNVGIGSAALYSNDEGNENTAVGYQAGWGGFGIGHNASGCVYLGYKAGRSNTSSNKLFITNSEDATPLIGGDFSTDQVDINGTIKITGGSPGADKVLTSDANGLATWETPTVYASALNDLNDVITDGVSIFVGDQSGINDDGGNVNTALGYYALQTNTLGRFNVALGQSSAKSNTSGSQNTAIGYQTLYYNETGNNNTAIGYGAGIGSNGHRISGCVFLGHEAGKDNTFDNKLFIANSDDATPLIGGDFSTDQVDINGTIKITGGSPGADKVLTSDADGLASWQTKTYGATELNGLTDAITDGSSIFVGDQVGANDDGTNYNTAMGFESFITNTTGTRNTAFGYKALEVSNGGRNAAFGCNAMRQNTSGGYNTAIGVEALYYNQTGQHNIALGFEAGESTSGNSVSGCVFLGYRAGKSNTSSNKLFIDNSDDTTPLIGGDFSSDELYFNASKVGIGTDNPYELLEVAGTSGNTARMIVSDGEGSNRNALLFVSPSATYNYSRIDSYKYGTGLGGVELRINTSGNGNTIFGGDILPEAHKSKNLGSNTKAWDNAYADDFITLGSAAFANINVTKQLISFPPKEKKTGAFDEYTEKGLKELDPASLPKELTEDNALLIDEITTYNYKANYEQQQQIETLKKENAELKARLERLEKLIINKTQ